MQHSRHCLFIDFEFTMPEIRKKDEKREKYFPEILEAGVVYVVGDKIHEQFSAYVKPTVNPQLSTHCMQFLNISQDNIDSGITLSELTNILKKYHRDAQIITWGSNDMHILRQNCLNADLEFPLSGEEVDLSIEFKNFYGDKQHTGLWKAAEQYGKRGKGTHHHALDDALTAYFIYQLLEKDKQYLKQSHSSTIRERITFRNHHE